MNAIPAQLRGTFSLLLGGATVIACAGANDEEDSQSADVASQEESPQNSPAPSPNGESVRDSDVAGDPAPRTGEAETAIAETPSAQAAAPIDGPATTIDESGAPMDETATTIEESGAPMDETATTIEEGRAPTDETATTASGAAEPLAAPDAGANAPNPDAPVAEPEVPGAAYPDDCDAGYPCGIRG